MLGKLSMSVSVSRAAVNSCSQIRWLKSGEMCFLIKVLPHLTSDRATWFKGHI